MTAPVRLELEIDGPSHISWSPEPEERFGSGGFVAGGRVLVVDDEHIVRTWMARLLDEAGYAVEVAADGVEALRLALEDPIGFDLIVTDVRMPRMDGWQLGRRIQEERPELPILYISGYDGHAAPGPHAFLRKPFESEDLLRRVAELLRGH